MTRAHTSPSVPHGPNVLWQLFVSPNIPRSLKLGVRLPLAVGVAATGTILGVPAGYNALTTDYGCAEIAVKPRDDAITVVQKAAKQLGIPNEGHARDAVIHAAQGAQGPIPLDPARDALNTCATYNPLSGWNITAGVTHP